MAEVLAPTLKPLDEEFERGFAGMTQDAVALAELEDRAHGDHCAMVADMPEGHRRFLVGFKRGEPDWELLGIPEARHLPAVLWKRRNLDRLPADKRRELADARERVLFP
ncbi:MAG: hypothetical protein WDN24_07845 [Sphingomonas sp.]